MISFPNAKINIGLYITEKRDDGFHNIESLLYPVPFHDILEISKSNAPHTSIKQMGVKIEDIDANDISVMQAYNLLKKDFSLPPIEIILYKKIPSGAGLGGGSSDATSMLKLLNKYLKLNINNQQLKNYAEQLGSDNSFFVDNTPQIATQRGNILQPLNLYLNGYYILLINPKLHISTALAYSGIIPKKANFNLEQVPNLPISEWKEQIKNDFEESLYPKYPLLKEIKEALYKSGAIYASLSGSGATTYAIYKNKPKISSELEQYICFEGEL